MSDVTANRILNGLNARELALIRPYLVEVPLEFGSVIAEPGHPAEFVYFPTDSALSIVGTTEQGGTVEVATVGPEGVAGVSALLGRNHLPFRIVAQVAGHAWRSPTEAVTRHLKECGELHERLLAYSGTMIFQMGQSAICNRFHNAKQRLARWLLLTMDRAGARDLPLTHEFISSMVGGPRSAITEAASALREAGAIDYRRGLVSVADQERLQREACECYAAVRPLVNGHPRQ